MRLINAIFIKANAAAKTADRGDLTRQIGLGGFALSDTAPLSARRYAEILRDYGRTRGICSIMPLSARNPIPSTPRAASPIRSNSVPPAYPWQDFKNAARAAVSCTIPPPSIPIGRNGGSVAGWARHQS